MAALLRSAASNSWCRSPRKRRIRRQRVGLCEQGREMVFLHDQVSLVRGGGCRFGREYLVEIDRVGLAARFVAEGHDCCSLKVKLAQLAMPSPSGLKPSDESIGD